jgi:hypothetical protein
LFEEFCNWAIKQHPSDPCMQEDNLVRPSLDLRKESPIMESPIVSNSLLARIDNDFTNVEIEDHLELASQVSTESNLSFLRNSSSEQHKKPAVPATAALSHITDCIDIAQDYVVVERTDQNEPAKQLLAFVKQSEVEINEALQQLPLQQARILPKKSAAGYSVIQPDVEVLSKVCTAESSNLPTARHYCGIVHCDGLHRLFIAL